MKLRWLIVRARVRLARLVWPPVDPLPALFVAVEDGARIDSVCIVDGDTVLLELPVGRGLRKGDEFTVDQEIEVCYSSGASETVRAQWVPVNGYPAALHAPDEVAQSGKNIAASIVSTEA